MKVKRKPIIYISGPYTHPYVVHNVRRAIDSADIVYTFGGIPIIPHLFLLWDFIFPREWGEWVDIGCEILKVCDAVLRLDGASLGADLEVKRATELGIPVLFSADEVRKFVKEWDKKWEEKEDTNAN